MRGVQDLHGIRGYGFLVRWGALFIALAGAGTWAALAMSDDSTGIPAMALVVTAGAYLARHSLECLSAEIQRLDTHLWVGVDYLLRWASWLVAALAGAALVLHLARDLVAAPALPRYLVTGAFGALVIAGITIVVASHHFGYKARAFAEQLLRQARKDGMERIAKGLENYLSSTQRNPAPIVRGVGMLNSEQRPFYDPAEFPFLQILVDNYDIILEELQVLLAARHQAQASKTHGFRAYFYGNLTHRGWQVCLLQNGNDWIEENAALCPETVRIIKSIPGHFTRLGGFALLEPGTHVAAHRDANDMTLNCHLGMMIPKGDCGIRLGLETRTWKERELLVFDTVYEHEVWNHTDEPRVILQITFLRPELSEAEKIWWSRNFWFADLRTDDAA